MPRILQAVQLMALFTRKLGVKEGAKVVFYEHDGRIVIDNAEKLNLAQRLREGGVAAFHDGRGVYFMTGTPISKTIAEVYAPPLLSLKLSGKQGGASSVYLPATRSAVRCVFRQNVHSTARLP